MIANPTSRRSILSGLAASALAPLAGLFGGRAKAAGYTVGQFADDVERSEYIAQAAAPLRMPTTEYQVVWRSPDGNGVIWGGPFLSYGDAARCRDESSYEDRPPHPIVGPVRRGEIRCRVVGEWTRMLDEA